ncbi:tRNA pseudouridylate synthase [Ostreococcus tauri]|uniref:tRNA pseudouridylate synthase n=1 Tax=Ostreococcus tauri TaxID=70448 RepID=A0A1Y5I6S0_OSTTA|nr:tRNA pseudouridylate synthase [Ostreococcus tauri]
MAAADATDVVDDVAPEATAPSTVDAPERALNKLPPSNPNKKRKCALTFAYVGAGYAGMQRNPGVRTIEGELEGAIARAGGISDANAGDFSKVQWTRAARTDKGVSAVGQVIALKMVMEPDGMLARINEALPERFEVFGIDRVTGGFNAKTMCDRRKYEYVIPTWAFDPNLFVEGAEKEKFTFTEETRRRVERVLGNYCGTHNFHNYTVKVKPTDAQAKRYILSFECSQPFEVDGEEFVRCEVVGQSFMLHQIRKLIGTMLAVMRGTLDEDDQKFAILSHQFVPTPMAPELGLFLCECIYKAYNDKFGSVHDNFELEKYRDKSEAFKRAHVYTHIARQEREQSTLRNWIKDVLHDGLRDSFDVSMAASLRAEEKLDPTRVGHRAPKGTKRGAEEEHATQMSVDAFQDVLTVAAERAKKRKLERRQDDWTPRAAAPTPSENKQARPSAPTETAIPDDELSDST